MSERAARAVGIVVGLVAFVIVIALGLIVGEGAMDKRGARKLLGIAAIFCGVTSGQWVTRRLRQNSGGDGGIVEGAAATGDSGPAKGAGESDVAE